jgi:hypothetical protein
MPNYDHQNNEYEAENQAEYGRRDSQRPKQTSRRAHYRRRGSSSSFNGIHRRRNKRHAT